MNITLKKFQQNKRLSQETRCYGADIHLDGVKVGETTNAGHGGPDCVHWTDKNAGEKIQKYAEELHPTFKDVGMCLEVLIGDIIDDMETEKTFRRLCKTKTVIRFKGDAKGTCHSFKVPFSPKIEEQVRQRFGDKLEEIVNKRYLTA